MQFDYDKLIEDYETGLFTTLRGFGPAAEFLETWVPDEDPVKSLLNMVEAAEISGQSAFSIVLGKASAERLDVRALKEATAGLAGIDTQTRGDGLLISFSDIGGA